jgi:hypothetical protein
MTTPRSLVRSAAALVLVALLLGPSAHAGPVTDRPPGPPPSPALGYDTNESLMMGPGCGANVS